MILHSVGRDCLFLNWALPVEVLPPLRPPLTYDTLRWQEREWVFVSAVLFRQEGLGWTRVYLPRVGYPQLSLRLCTRDSDRVPSYLLGCVLIPAWVLPSARLVSRQPTRKGTFDYPHPGEHAPGVERCWRVRGRGRLTVSAREASPQTGAGPSLGSWVQTVSYFRQRRHWYFDAADGLRRIEVGQRTAQEVAMKAEVEEDDLLAASLAVQGLDSWPSLHSAWLSPEIPYVFELGRSVEAPLPSRVPAPG